MSEGAGALNTKAFADALQRARQLAAKLGAGASGGSAPSGATSPPSQAPGFGLKRAADFDSEPEAKRMAAISDPFGAQLAAMKGSGMGGGVTGTNSPSFPGMGITMGLSIGGSGMACTEEIHIPDGLVGLIIGRGGEQVSRIQAETGCKVQVAPDNGTGKDRSCYLQGTKEAIERAKNLVMEIVSSKSHEISRPGGGMGMPTGNMMGGAGGNPMGGGGGGPKGGPGSTSIEMMIQGAKVGLIIGKGGETIRNLQDKSGTKMYILQDNMFEECDKPLRIVGDPDLVEHARQLVLELISETPSKHEFKPKSEYGSGGGGPMMGGGERNSSGGFGLETMKFPVPKISVGLIIGKGGEMIKRIQMETGAKVQFDPINSTMGDMDEQLAIITGKSDQIREAQLRIEDLVETALNGGSGSGKSDGPPGRGGHGGGMGDRERMDRVPRNSNWDGGHGGAGPGRGGPGAAGGGPRGEFDEERMHIPVNRVGMVIGKGGETIRSINQQTGAHCEIDRNGPQDGPERIFVIRGSRQQIQHAKDLIMEKVNTLPPGRGGPRERGGGGEYGGQNQGWGGGSNGGGGHGGGGYGHQNYQDPSKSGADPNQAWAAYAQYYQQAAQQGGQAPGAQQQDFSNEWIQYFRSIGQHQQADMLEQQTKAAKAAAGGSDPGPPGVGTPSHPSQQPGPPGTGTGAPGATAAPNGNTAAAPTADFSLQWAEHYRSLGKIQEAEAIEAYIKAQKNGAAQVPAQQPAVPGAGAAYGNYNYGAPGGAGYSYPYGNGQGSQPQQPRAPGADDLAPPGSK